MQPKSTEIWTQIVERTLLQQSIEGDQPEPPPSGNTQAAEHASDPRLDLPPDVLGPGGWFRPKTTR